MRNEYPEDTFTENDVFLALEQAGLRYKNGHRYILSQCPTHEDKHPSVQIYKDDWFVNCHAGCGRFHITKAFPWLRDNSKHPAGQKLLRRAVRKEPEVKYKTFDLMEYWKTLPTIPRNHYFKNIPLEVLDDLGWRFVPQNNQYFIPYFSASKQTIPFAQYRNLGENPNPRFIMLKDAKPTCYGTWNLDNPKLFVVEGTSDAAVLEYAAVPWIALPSAASGELMKAMAGYCRENGIELVYAGDNDAAGEKLREALDEVMAYRVKQARSPYKDWGEMLEAEGIESIQDYCYPELFPEEQVAKEVEQNMKTPLEHVQEVFPGAVELKIV